MSTALVLQNTKYPHNVGGALRAAAAFGVDELWWTGERVVLPHKYEKKERRARLPREERMRGYKEDVNFGVDQDALRNCIARGLTPVAVEVDGTFENLVHFQHPLDAVYVFGPEDGSVSKGWKHACHRFVYIPTHYCLNLAAAVNVVLYDRYAKRVAAGLEASQTLWDLLQAEPREEQVHFASDLIKAGFRGE